LLELLVDESELSLEGLVVASDLDSDVLVDDELSLEPFLLSTGGLGRP